MKKIINFVLIITAFLTLFGVTNFVRAQKNNDIANENSQNNFSYTLPYPGILPDHPLFFLKTLRDNLVSMMISDPVKKIEFNLLMADKRINSALFLSQKNKFEIIPSVISKAQDNLNLVLSGLKNLKNQNQNISNLSDRVNNATLKHTQVLKEIIKNAPEDLKGEIRDALERENKIQIEIQQLRKS